MASSPVPAPAAPLAPAAQAHLAPQRVLPGNAWRSPIHTTGADPVGGAYGTWTSALTYKASFHDGFAFYPFLGATYPENLPLRWTTESVHAGGEPWIDVQGDPQHHRTDWRYEYLHRGMTEAYDVREDGVEQLFVIAAKPTRPGDIVVTGRIDTRLHCAGGATAQAEHQALTFADDNGKPLVRYGEAFAIDALGRRTPAKTSFDGSRIRLTVPAAFVADAAFPLTIDPLTTRVIIATWSTSFGLASYPEVGRDDESVTDNLMTFYSRQFSATDFDGYARLTDDDFSGTSLVYTDITTSWSTTRAGVAYVAAADRWALCMQREFVSPNTVRVRVYFHDAGNVTLNSGVTAFHDPSSAECNWYPSVGGTNGFSTTGSNALLAYQADFTTTKTNTTASRIYTVLVDCATRTIGIRAQLDNHVAGADSEFPDVNQESNGGTSSWIVAWEQYNNTIGGDDVDVYCSRVEYTNVAVGHTFMGFDSGTPTHKQQPQVSGRDGRYCVSMVRSTARGSAGSASGAEIDVERFDWSETSTSPVKLGPKVVAAGGAANYRNGGIAYDDNTTSHWALVYQRGADSVGDTFVVRVGHTGGATESATLYSGPNGAFAPNVVYDDDAYEFQCVYASTDANLPIYGQRLQYSAIAGTQFYGVDCGPGYQLATNEPYAGHEFFRVTLRGLATGTPCALQVALARNAAGISLNFIGATGCFYYLDPNYFLFSVGASASTAGLTLALPDNPVYIGDLFTTWAYLAPGLNPAGLGTTQGMRVQVR